MMSKLIFLTITMFSLTRVLSQELRNVSQIDETVYAIDSTLKVDSIRQFVHPLFSDDGGDIFLIHHYSIDTVNRIFYKAFYDYVNFEQIMFYYKNQKIIKAIISDTSIKANPYRCEYYFYKDSIFLVKEQGVPGSKNTWNKKTIASQAKQYLIDFSAICDMLNRRK